MKRAKQRRGMTYFSTQRDIVQCALKWQRARDEVSVKGMLAQLETEDQLTEVIRAFLRTKDAR
jgi:hypothetical protein